MSGLLERHLMLLASLRLFIQRDINMKHTSWKWGNSL